MTLWDVPCYPGTSLAILDRRPLHAQPAAKRYPAQEFVWPRLVGPDSSQWRKYQQLLSTSDATISCSM